MSNPVPGRLCRYCGVEKAWIYSGKKLRDGSKIYTNEFAVRWAGRRCPECERKRVLAAVKCNAFEKDLILKKLKEAGYKIKSSAFPVIIEKDGEKLRVGVKQAKVEDGKIVLNKSDPEEADLYALVFSSVRLCSKEKMAELAGQMEIFVPDKIRRNRAENNIAGAVKE